MTPPTVDRQLLRIYLSDDVAGAAGALSRAQRMARAYRETPLGPPLDRFAGERPTSAPCSSRRPTGSTFR